MKIELIELPRITIENFADQENLVMVVTERRKEITDVSRYFAAFKNVEVLTNGCLASVYGDGIHPDYAIAHYAQKISPTRIVVDAMKASRREILVPRLSPMSKSLTTLPDQV